MHADAVGRSESQLTTNSSDSPVSCREDLEAAATLLSLRSASVDASPRANPSCQSRLQTAVTPSYPSAPNDSAARASAGCISSSSERVRMLREIASSVRPSIPRTLPTTRRSRVVADALWQALKLPAAPRTRMLRDIAEGC
jgi:hypothetical protein